jgi:branched-chain amino acid transport system substrate-binding protein
MNAFVDMRRIFGSTAVLLVGVMLGLAPLRAAEPAPVRIEAIVSQTGNFSFTGARISEALHVLEGVVNAKGGVNGRPIHFDFVDDQTNAVVAVQLVNAVIAQGTPYFLGPISAAACAAVIPLVAKNGPLDYCLSPVATGPAGGYVFSVGAGTSLNNLVMVRFFHNKGWNRVGILAATDASCRGAEQQIEDAIALPENRGMQVAVSEHFNPTDLSVAAQVARIKAATPQGVFTCASGTVFGTVVHSLHDGGLDIPTAASSANMDYEQLASYAGLLPRELYFTGPRGIVEDTSLRPGPVKDAQTAYFNAFRAAKVRPGDESALVWDQTMIVVDALRHAGANPTAAKLHDYIEGLHDWAGIAGIYYFRDGSQRGIGQNAIQSYRWDAAHGTFTVASRPGGRLK